MWRREAGRGGVEPDVACRGAFSHREAWQDWLGQQEGGQEWDIWIHSIMSVLTKTLVVVQNTSLKIL